MKTIFFLLIAFFSAGAWAYSNFIGHGYTSCLNCHFNPFGGGPLNDYGRVIDATLVSSRAFYPKEWTEEKIAYTSGFLFRKPKQDWLRTQINYRGFQMVRNPGSSKAETKQWINMQADARVVMKFGENDKFLAVANYGYSPTPTPAPNREDQPEWRSREYYLGYRFTPKVGIYAGLMDKVYGIRVIEHIAFSRVNPQVTQNDQVHGVAAHLLGEKWEGGVHGFVGNLEQDSDIRQQGASMMVERTVFDTHRVGGSFMRSESDFVRLTSYSGHARLNLKEGSSLQTEIGQTKRETQNGSGDLTSRYGLLQTYLRPVKGLYVLANIEYNRANIDEEDYAVRWGPGVQYFPIQRVELRFDMYNTRRFAPNSSSTDSWMYLLQTHLWL